MSEHITIDSIENIDLIIDTYNIDTKDKNNEIFEELTKWDELEIYKKSDLPEYFGLKNAEFLQDLIITPKQNITIGIDPEHSELYWPEFPTNNPELLKKGGSHGYNDITDGYSTEGQNPDMRGMFMAIGPSFRKGLQHNTNGSN